MKVQNIIHGEVITDPSKLQEILGLSINDNCMINVGRFLDNAPNVEHAGYQLPMVMMSVKVARITEHNLTDFIQRMGYMDACGKSAIDLPNGVEDLAVLHRKLKGWIDEGWEIETDLSHMERQDFVEWTEFKVTQEVLREVRELRSTLKTKLEEELPEAAKELT